MSIVEAHNDQQLIERILLSRAKTEGEVRVVEHASHVLQVMQWLLAPLDLTHDEQSVLLLAAVLHDVGKAVTEPDGKTWRHSRASADIMPLLLANPDFCDALSAAGVRTDLSPENIERVRRLVLEHHGMKGDTLLDVVGAPLLVVADQLASALEAGVCGSLAGILGEGVGGTALTALAAAGRAPWAEAEIHHIELPSDTPADALLAETLLERVRDEAIAAGMELVMRGPAEAWFAGPLEALEPVLDLAIGTADVLDVADMRRIYEAGHFPRPPKANMTELRYFFASDEVACLVLRDLWTRRAAEFRATCERHGFTFDRLVNGVDPATLADPILLGQLLHSAVRSWLAKLDPGGAAEIDEDVVAWAQKSCHYTVDAATWKRVVERTIAAHPDLEDDIRSIAALIRKGTTCRSIAMAVREVLDVREELANGGVRFRIRDIAWVDHTPPAVPLPSARVNGAHQNKPCFICRNRVGTVRATTMIAGATEGDGIWASAGHRKYPLVCAWCHASAIHALPLVTMRILNGQRKVRELNYLYVETILSRNRLATALADLGFMDPVSAREAVRPASEAQPLDEATEQLFQDILGEVPEESVLLGVAGLADSLPVRALAARILPSNTPLASRAVFAIPAPVFFGQHATSDLNQKVLELVGLGLIATLRQRIGVARFDLRTSSTRGVLHVHADRVSDEELRRAQMGLAIAEFRRRFLACDNTGQSPHELDVAFMLALVENPREAVNRLIREIMGATPWIPATKAKIQALVSMVDRMAPIESDPYSALLDSVLQDLMDVSAVSPTTTPFIQVDGKWRMMTNERLCGGFHGFWEVSDRVTLERWANDLRQRVCRVKNLSLADRRSRIIDRVVRRIVDFSAEHGVHIHEIKRRLCAQNYLGVFSASRRRNPEMAEQIVDPVRVLVPEAVLAGERVW